MILYRLKLQQMSITLLFEITWYLKSHAKTRNSRMDLYCEFELRNLTNTKIDAAKDHGKNYMEVRPPLVRHL